MNILPKFFTPISSDNKKHGRLAPVLFLVLLVLLPMAFFLSLRFGSTDVSLWEGLRAVLSGEDTAEGRILLYLRLPRALGALFAGGALAVSGVLIQAVLQNPMAAPNVIGVNSGAGLGAVLMLAVFPSGVTFLPLAAFLGAVGACLCIYAVASRTRAGRSTVILVGIAIGSVLNAGINTVKTLYPDSVYDADAFMIGGLSGVTYPRLLPAAALISLALVLALFLARRGDILALGEDTARSLGLRVGRTRATFLILAAVLAGAAVSFAGLLGFVGLLVPHICRMFTGENHRWLIPVSALGGGFLVLICDLLCRVLFAPYELPVGILLSFVGGPFFLILVLGRKKRRD